MRKSLLILAAFTPLMFAQTQTLSYTYSGLPLPVYPNDWNTWSIISIFFPRSLAVTKVTVSAQVQYSGVGDLNVYLWSPAGTRTKLLERNCGSLQNIDTTFDDSAATRFHITIDETPELDGGYAVFGKVKKDNLDVLRKIAVQPTIKDDSERDGRHRPEKKIVIKKVTIKVEVATQI